MLAAILSFAPLLAAAPPPDGPSLYRERRFAAAEAELRREIKLRPRDQAPRLFLIRTLVELDRIPEALAELERLLAPASSPSPETRFQAGVILRELADRRFHDLNRLAPDSAAVRQLAGRQFEREGNLDEALRQYRAALTAEPGRAGLHYEIGNILWRQRELDAARTELEAELARSPHHGLANLRLGQLHAARGDDAAAVPYLEKAVEAIPGNPDPRREMGKAYRKTGRLQDARRQWEAVAKLRPADDQVHFLLGNLYRDLGEAELSRRELARHREILEKRRLSAEQR